VHDLGGLLDDFTTLDEDELDVAWIAHIWIDTTMGTVCTSSLLWCLIDLDVLNDEVAGIETFGVGVRLGVLEETEKELSGLDRPASLGDTESLSLSGPASATSISPHGDGLLVLLNILQICQRALQLPTLSKSSCT